MKYLYLILVALACMNGLTAYADNILVREDRIWECVSNHQLSYEMRYMKFDGTREYAGHEYSRVRTFKKIEWELDVKNWSPTNEVAEDDLDITEAWMREESGQVYLLCNPENPKLSEISDGVREFKIYDFCCDAGSSYKSVAMIPFMSSIRDIYEGTYNVESISETFVADNVTMVQNVKFTTTENPDYSNDNQLYAIVSGVGIVDGGCLFNLQTFDFIISNSYIDVFTRFYDIDGNILYGNTDNDFGISERGFASVKANSNGSIKLQYEHNTLHATSAAEVISITVADLSGRMVLREEGSGEVSLDASQLQPGVYVATANAAGRSRTIKIMRK